ncbi:hypothetical protein OKA05_29165 [Luteolibacter arcticus]|uniref:Uncharacterized protein n=1 Tax=Luteolibacter arcticus TaxID=1581411 RepID=A0ABT3GSZ5_9BACT|nr:hypothetical protein [Luteolibacter arcticus]MCW1926659.1 hypothetical protein [Luteolibacter arcticus]
MKRMKALVMYLVFSLLAALPGEARAVRSLEMKALMKESALVFAGRVKSVAPSGLTTVLTYPTWDGLVFEWLKVEVEVLEPMKGVKKAQVVRTMMLSMRGEGLVINGPGVVEPKVGRLYLLCLLPTTTAGVYASITAPFDDDEGVFLLDRKGWTDGATYYDEKGKETPFHKQDDKNAALWHLVDRKGAIVPAGAEAIRKSYAAELATPAPKDSVIHLKWKKEEGRGGWQWNVPDEGGKGKKSKGSTGPASK